MKKIVLALCGALALAACNQTEQPDPCLGATDVKQCEAIASATGGDRGGSNNSLLYGVGGYLLGSMMGGSRNSHTTTVINRHYYAPRPTYRPTYRSSWGSSRSSWSSWSRPSYSSSFRSSGFGRRR